MRAVNLVFKCLLFISFIGASCTPPAPTGDGPCQQNNGECDELTTCEVNSFGLVVCGECPAGYSGNGQEGCNNIDECAAQPPNLCDENATCEDSTPGYECVCNTGYSGDGTDCRDIDECLEELDECPENSTCRNIMGGYECQCDEGYAMNDNGACIIDPCSEDNGGCPEEELCTYEDGAVVCTACDEGYAYNDDNECVNIDECAEGRDNCDDMATCVDETPGFSCLCNPGYGGTGEVCIDVNECLSQPCPAQQVCVNLPGEYECRATCPEGTILIAQACVVDECLENNGDCGMYRLCNMTQDGVECGNCLNGYRNNNGVCEDVNECETNNNDCDTNASCTNTNGSFICSCNQGYEGNGTSCTNIDDCANNPCLNGSSCIDGVGSFSCECINGFFGDRCEDTCVTDADCNNNLGTCTELSGVSSCYCPPGYQGLHCELYNNPCDDDPCQNGGACNADGADYTCECPTGFEGGHCENAEGGCLNADDCSDDFPFCENNLCVQCQNDSQCPDDNNLCNGTEFCDGSNTCSHTGNPCDGDDTCLAQAGSFLCSGGDRLCNNTYPCDDGIWCNGLESCELPPQLTAGRFWGKTPHQTNRSASAKTTHLLATHRWFATKPTILACNASPRTIAPNRFQPVMVSPNVSTTPVGFRVIPVPKRPTPFVSAMAQPILVVYAMNTMTVMTGCHAQQTPVPLGHAKILTTAPPAFATMTWIAVLNASAI